MSVNALLCHCIQVPTARFNMPSCVYSLLVHKSLTLQLISKSQVYTELHGNQTMLYSPLYVLVDIWCFCRHVGLYGTGNSLILAVIKYNMYVLYVCTV